MRLTLRQKIVGLATAAAVVPAAVLLSLTAAERHSVARNVEGELISLARQYIVQVAADVHHMCTASNELVRRQVTHNLDAASLLLRRAGQVRLGAERVDWQAEHQDDQRVVRLSLPRMSLGGVPLGRTRRFEDPLPVVDEVHRLTGLTCSIFQRMNEEGDMLRVASSVAAPDGQRAIGSYYPAKDTDGRSQPVIEAVLNGERHVGLTVAWGHFHLTGYEPIRDGAGRVIGMVGLGVRIEEMEHLRQAIQKTRIGRSGYIYVLGAQGRHRGVYIVSRGGRRDGESVWDVRDEAGVAFLQPIIQRVVQHPPGEVLVERYSWRESDEEAPRDKLVALAYFAPWDWVIGACAYPDDYESRDGKVSDARNRAESIIDELLFRQLVAGGLLLVLAGLVALSVSSRITRPLRLTTEMAGRIAAGEVGTVNRALQDGLSSEAAPPADEVGLLQAAFRSMTSNLADLIGQVQRSGIQITTATTQIAAAARGLEATVAEQAASTREVTATSRQIASTSEELVGTMGRVGETITGTGALAEAGRDGLTRMETAMRALVEATGTITHRLAVIDDKTERISGVVTTIGKVSDQTNLLSLNAAIEAEKAGEYGRGFSVVAKEISRLADQTAIASKEIGVMVRDMRSAVSSGVMEMDRFADEVRRSVAEVASIAGDLGRILDQVRELWPRFEEVESGMHLQVSAAGQIHQAMDQLADVADVTRQSLVDFQRVTDQLDGAVKGLRSVVSRFRIEE